MASKIFYYYDSRFYSQPEKIDDPRHIRDPITGHPNFDSYKSVNWNQLLKDAQNWISEDRSDRSITHRFLIIEGILIFECSALRQLMDLRIFLTLDYETMVARRRLRDYGPADPPGYFDKYVWPSYIKVLNNLPKVDDNVASVNASTISPSELLDQVIKKAVIYESA
ncbi:hypothetical protein P879_01590 [Paragonimus westermani]|uniref:Nicotinamide riboside kinase n=1 Tax=Paragonimus westermani TaxID=34504 RepID=A0A8T0DTE3_9TREM|nr:hypothetical protein P879_01590 [Paragonimus westermani]